MDSQVTTNRLPSGNNSVPAVHIPKATKPTDKSDSKRTVHTAEMHLSSSNGAETPGRAHQTRPVSSDVLTGNVKGDYQTTMAPSLAKQESLSGFNNDLLVV